METIYIETTVVSYLVANPSRDSILAAHQQLTRQWWQDERSRWHCMTFSQVLREPARCGAGYGMKEDGELMELEREALVENRKQVLEF